MTLHQTLVAIEEAWDEQFEADCEGWSVLMPLIEKAKRSCEEGNPYTKHCLNSMNQFQHIRSQGFVALENKLPIEIRRTVGKTIPTFKRTNPTPLSDLKKCWGDGRSTYFLHTTIGLWDTDTRTRSRGIGWDFITRRMRGR